MPAGERDEDLGGADPPSPDCLPEARVLRFVRGDLGEAELANAERHLAACAACRRVVADTARFFAADAGSGTGAEDGPAARTGDAPGVGEPTGDAPLRGGDRIARYQIRAPLGAGGAGVVYLAHDPQLDRDVALKLFWQRRFRHGAADDEARFLREARAMARLSHANVVHVHDAGVHDGQPYIVMERVDGESLARWLRAKRRPWREILRVFLEAGRGLTAAHAAELVHGDFKPDNVLVATDGHARVTDFGLARRRRAPMPTDPGIQLPGRDGDGRGAPARDDRMTRATTRSGTPAFMAPEQHAGFAPDARSDQFSFCLALYEALYGRRPPEAAAPTTGSPAAVDPHVPAVPVDPVPAALLPLLRRGLAPRPRDRFGSMNDLLAALEAACRRADGDPWRRRAAVAITGAAILGVALWRLLAGSAPVCGNGEVEAGEECDDGNREPADACLPSCRFNVCGDGVLRPTVEDCDDGNTIGGDGCEANCTRCEGGDARFFWTANGHCYSRSEAPETWAGAMQACRRRDAHLATYSSGGEIEAVSAGLMDGTTATYWIGLLDADRAGGYQWLSQELLFPLNWLSSQKPPPGLCGAQGRGYPWSVDPCGERRGYVCERPDWVVRQEDRHAYRAFFPAVGWDAARMLCERHGGRLVVIETAAENQFLGAHFFGTFWVGASRKAGDQGFRWLGGAVVDPADFAAGEPDIATPRACVVRGPDLLLHDRSCTPSGRLPLQSAVCEIE